MRIENATWLTTMADIGFDRQCLFKSLLPSLRGDQLPYLTTHGSLQCIRQATSLNRSSGVDIV